LILFKDHGVTEHGFKYLIKAIVEGLPDLIEISSRMSLFSFLFQIIFLNKYLLLLTIPFIPVSGWLCSSFHSYRNSFSSEFTDLCSLLCITQDFHENFESLFHFLGVCLYQVAELLVPIFPVPDVTEKARIENRNPLAFENVANNMYLYMILLFLNKVLNK